MGAQPDLARTAINIVAGRLWGRGRFRERFFLSPFDSRSTQALWSWSLFLRRRLHAECTDCCQNMSSHAAPSLTLSRKTVSSPDLALCLGSARTRTTTAGLADRPGKRQQLPAACLASARRARHVPLSTRRPGPAGLAVQMQIRVQLDRGASPPAVLQPLYASLEMRRSRILPDISALARACQRRRQWRAGGTHGRVGPGGLRTLAASPGLPRSVTLRGRYFLPASRPAPAFRKQSEDGCVAQRTAVPLWRHPAWLDRVSGVVRNGLCF